MQDDVPPELNLHSPQRQLIELRMAHADIDSVIDRLTELSPGTAPADELALRRLKKRRLQLRDQINQLEVGLDPPEPA